MEPESQRNLTGMVLMAVLGGLANQANQILTGKKVPWINFLIRAPISAFIGLLCWHFFPHDTPWSFVFAGLLSWMGANGISFLINMVVKSKDSK